MEDLFNGGFDTEESTPNTEQENTKKSSNKLFSGSAIKVDKNDFKIHTSEEQNNSNENKNKESILVPIIKNSESDIKSTVSIIDESDEKSSIQLLDEKISVSVLDDANNVNADLETYYSSVKKQADDFLNISKAIKLVLNDTDNTNARNYAKSLTTLKTNIDNLRKDKNKPYDEKIKENNKYANDIVNSVSIELDRLKNNITLYEQEKERKRVLEQKRLEQEAKDKAEKERLERERVDKIKAEIDRLKKDGNEKINKANTSIELNDIQQKLTSWKLKAEFFAEFLNEAETIKTDLLNSINSRRPLIESLEKAKKDAEKLEGEKKEQAKKELENKQRLLEEENKRKEEQERADKIQKENEELIAKQELMSIIASFGVSNMDYYMTNVIEKYGSASEAVNKREQLISDYQQTLIQKAEISTVKSNKVKNIRTDFLFNIVDVNMIPREFLTVDESKIKKAIQENRKYLEKDLNSYKIDGVMIYPKKSSIIK